MKLYPTSDKTLAIYYDETQKERIKNIRFSVEKLIDEIRRDGKNCNYHTEDNEGLWVYYDWSTGLEFEDHIGGGYYINFEEDWYNGKVLVTVYAEWFDSYAEDNNLEKCKDKESQIKDALVELERFIRNL